MNKKMKVTLILLFSLCSILITNKGTIGESIDTTEDRYINNDEEIKAVINDEIIKETEVQYKTVEINQPPHDVGTGEFIYPVDGVYTSGFGQRWGRLHGGIDLAVPQGTKILAADNAKVIYTGECGSYGLLIKLDHGNGYVTYYAHCSEFLKNVGDCVTKGEAIALSGNTGNSTGPHCHFEIRYNNEVKDPLEYLK